MRNLKSGFSGFFAALNLTCKICCKCCNVRLDQWFSPFLGALLKIKFPGSRVDFTRSQGFCKPNLRNQSSRRLKGGVPNPVNHQARRPVIGASVFSTRVGRNSSSWEGLGKIAFQTTMCAATLLLLLGRAANEGCRAHPSLTLEVNPQTEHQLNEGLHLMRRPQPVTV